MATATLLGLSLPPPALTLLRLAPLLSTTASLTHAYMEYLTTTSFLVPPPTSNALTRTMAKATAPLPHKTAPELAAATDVVVPAWFVNFFNTGVYSVLALNGTTLFTAAANLWAVGGLGGARAWYLAGFAAALGHLAFVPGVAGSVEGLYGLCVRGCKGERKAEDEGRAAALVREWVSVHKVRWGSVDLAAWVCFGVGVVGVLTV
ncbi:hypothetical protein P171DRAFT_267185 [Karstenula rhodostoma CBS 690.94]|uniref:DUF1772-domain-containing protein n=1 Tax=Karstenula rhodostoma CBS 690.94 TaxID=1392251 RepID=A0A9P4PLV7_9PLEO|nr:hypothetical protein P171DRAFT_267185 [Karstenula rhodostoma CBS 690.94]